jgi:hypothetical protein
LYTRQLKGGFDVFADRLEIQQILHKHRTSIFDILHQSPVNTQPEHQTEPKARDELVNLAEQLIECLFVEPFEPQKAEALGISLARVCRVNLKVFGTLPGLLALQFTQGLPADQIIALQPRLSTLISYLTIGWEALSCSLTWMPSAMTVLVAEFGYTPAVQEEIRVPLSVLAGRDGVRESLWRTESYILKERR